MSEPDSPLASLNVLEETEAGGIAGFVLLYTNTQGSFVFIYRHVDYINLHGNDDMRKILRNASIRSVLQPDLHD